MAVDQSFVIKKLQNMEEMYAVYSAVTKMPFATCDEETFNDQVWVFADKEKVQEFSKKYTEEKILLMGVRVKKEEAPMFYMNLFAMGINEVVFQDGEAQNRIPLENIVRKPGVKPDREALKDLEEEMSVNLVKSKFLLPVEVEEKEDGTPGNIRVIYVQNKEGDRFQPIFTDTNEMLKHYRNKQTKHRLLQVPFDQLPKYMIKDIKGYVLNPEGFNLILSQKQIQQLLTFYKTDKED